jgi:peptidylprolyl isomerase
LAFALAFGGAAGGGAWAQEGASASKAAGWSDPEFAKIAEQLTGTWKSSAPIEGGGGTFEAMVSIAPVAIAGVPDAMYLEAARGDALDRPYRQGVLQLHRFNGKLRMKTLEFRRSRGEFLPAVGTWAAPEVFPSKITGADLVTTLDIELSASGNGYTGKTPYPYPTSTGNAVEMTSEILFDGTSFKTADRGVDASGKQVWGPAAGNMYAFARVASPVRVLRQDGGLVSVTYPGTLEGSTAGEGDQISVHYIGMLQDGFIFDSSYSRNSPFTYNFGQKLVDGWIRTMADAQKGLKRRIFVPGALGYPEGRGQSKIPPMADLIFSIDVLNVSKPEPAPVKAPEEGTVEGAKSVK